jgi:hypothetical protein
MNKLNPTKIALIIFLMVIGLITILRSEAQAQQKSLPELKFGGYVKVDFIQDFDPIGNPFQFKTDAIPVEGTLSATQSGQTTIHARETRFTLTLLEDTPKGKFKAYIEGDFYGDNNAFRIRHAFGEFGHFLGGQTWTTFMDISARPRSLDYEGPDAEIFVRQAMIRWTHPLSPQWKLAVAAEMPGSQFVTATGLQGSARSNMPDLPAFLRYETTRAHFQVAGILRQIRFDGQGGSPDVSTMGFGGNVSFRVNTAGKSGLMGQFAFGKGIGRYIESLNGQNADAVFTSDNNLEALNARAAVLGYEQHWNPTLQTTIAFAVANLDENTLLSSSTIKQTQDGRVNLIWSPYQKMDIGGEVLYGLRKNQNDAEGEAWRFQFSMIYKIN